MKVRRDIAPPRYCERCGVIRIYKPSQKFCAECKRKLPTKTCEQCGKNFESRHGRKFCSRECLKERNRQYFRDKYEPTAPTKKNCLHCGKQFAGRSQRKYCDQYCAKKAFRKRKGENKRRLSHMQRAMKYGTECEPINPLRVFERDKYLCGICLAPVAKDRAVPHPLAATLDHIVPIARGGGHTWNNVRCAHFMCNSRKSDKLDEEITWPEVGHQSQLQN
jgi:5-methylcytosine-specific restriction endonuclease McrA